MLLWYIGGELVFITCYGKARKIIDCGEYGYPEFKSRVESFDLCDICVSNWSRGIFIAFPRLRNKLFAFASADFELLYINNSV